MKSKIFTYIWTPLAALAATAALSGCADDDLMPGGNPADSNAVTFTAFTAPADMAATTRSSDMPEYGPLVLEGTESGTPLYLHTYEVGKIGYVPGEEVDAMGTSTRANQVSDAGSLMKFHKNFKVLARAADTGENYFGWTDTRAQGDDNTVWLTERTEYWPGQRRLTFHAVSPATEYHNLDDLRVADGFQFVYTARKGGSNDDAEHQPDLLLATGDCTKAASDAGRAPLRFHHALSAVKFAVRDVMGGEVVNVRISGVKASGRCSFAPDPVTGLGEVTWSGQTGTATYSQDFNYAVADRVVDPSDSSQDLLLNDKMPEKTFMLIPQEIPADAEIIVTLKRTGLTPESVEVRAKIRDNEVSEWKAGHEYVYTISTSRSNWTYVLTATGNHTGSTAAGAHNVTGGNYLYVYSPAYLTSRNGDNFYPHAEYGNSAFMDVRSYRYRTNRPSLTEPLKWTAENGGTAQYRVYGGKEEAVSGHDMTAAEWLPGRATLTGDGTTAAQGERRTMEFAIHHQITDWAGDTWMQNNAAYSGNSRSKPWDLSTCGGKLSKNTANCYVIDRQGWYSFPTVYGNAYKNGGDNKEAYIYSGAQTPVLTTFKAPAGDITSPEVPGGSYAKILWSDVYNTISDVTYSAGKITFRANRHNMQQGNIVIGLFNSTGKILWSWHIWVTEHWLNAEGQPNAYSSTGYFAGWRDDRNDPSSSVSALGWRNRGDVLIDNSHVSKSYDFHISPYNIGWCDPKNVDYLRRKGTMTVTQFMADGTPTGKTVSLPIIQDGQRVEYKVGNNTYYQWGRKDPFIGFVNHSSSEKRNFGDYDFKEVLGHASIADAATKPHEFYYNGIALDKNKPANGYSEWANTQALNLWNNNVQPMNSLTATGQKIVKTVYDPCPPGYMMPPAYMYRFIGTDANKSYGNISGGQNKDKINFNGTIPGGDRYTLLACAVDKSKQTVQNTVWFTSTGERWDRPGAIQNGDREVKAGQNFNPQIAYLWSGQCSRGKKADTNCSDGTTIPGTELIFNGYSLALGLDQSSDLTATQSEEAASRAATRAADGTPDAYIICAYFTARKTMARPVRAIREQ